MQFIKSIMFKNKFPVGTDLKGFNKAYVLA